MSDEIPLTNDECILLLQERLEEIWMHIQSLKDGTFTVVVNGMDGNQQAIRKAQLDYAMTKGAIVAIIDYDQKFGRLIESEYRGKID